jgi:hypothetical protein
VVLDNTYPSRAARNDVIEAAWGRGVPVRCIWLNTSVADAQINSVRRMLEVHGKLPTPEEIRGCSKTDHRYLLPDAQFRYERTLEAPALEEGFARLETREFVREPERAEGRALLFDFDDLVGSGAPVLVPDAVTIEASRREVVARWSAEGWFVFIHAWRPQVERKETTLNDVQACFVRLVELLGVACDFACCPHEAGPPVCWCRKPIPGSALEFAARRGVALARSIVVGSSQADRTMAERVGARFEAFESLMGLPIQ